MWIPYYPYLTFALISLALAIASSGALALIAWALRPKAGA